MKLTKKTETEILQVHNAYWESYIKGDVEAMHPLLAEEYTQVGSAEGEVFSNKKDAVQFLYDTIDQVAGKLEMRNRKTILEQQGHTILVHEFCDLYVLADDAWAFYSKFRATTFMKPKKEGWTILHQHSSFPDTKTEEGQNIAIDKIAEENRQLREAVKRRTFELESKNRELEIEASLERVRTVAMGMKKPNDMLDICRIISQQLALLNVKEIRNVQTAIIYETKGTYLNFEYYAKHDKTFITDVNFKLHPAQFEFVNVMLKGPEEFFSKHFNGKEVQDWYAYQQTTNQFADAYLATAASLNYYWYSMGPVALGMSTYIPLTGEDIVLFKRFRNVFELAYRRFMDIQKAEAQAREAQIELALERVRARTMAMHASDELADVAKLLFRQVKELGITAWTTGFNIWSEDNSSYIDWITDPSGEFLEPYTVDASRHPVFQAIRNARERGDDFFVSVLEGPEIIETYQLLSSFANQGQFQKILDSGTPFPTHQVNHFVFGARLSLLFITYEPCPEAWDIFKRFGKVFEQTYTRFLDLQKAEASAREARIEAALEKVRSRSLSVHKTGEFKEVIKVVFEKLQELEIQMTSVSINVFIENSRDTQVYICGSGENGLALSQFRLFHLDHPISNDRQEAREKGMNFFTKTYEAEQKNSFYAYQFEVSDLKYIPADIKKMVMESERYTISTALAKNSMIVVNDFEGNSLSAKEIDIIKRFSKVFEQAYTRFLDLQKAEAQAREAQIEAALERVRSRSMGMHKSDDLHEVIKVVTEQLSVLSLKFNVANFAKIDPDGSWNMWLSTPEQTYPALIHVPYLDHPIFNDVTEQITKNNDFYSHTYTLEESNIFFHHFFENTIAKNSPEERKQFVYSSKGFTRSLFSTKNIWFVVSRYDTTPFTDEENAVFKRFAKVFEQTYTRFLDLQKAEAQAKEAQIEAALERVRSRSMAMQKSEELKEVIQVVYEQFVHLNIHVEHTGFIIDYKANDDMHIWHADRQKIPNRVTIPYFDCAHWNSFNEAKEKGTGFFSNLLDFEEKNRFYQDLFKLVPGVPDEAKGYYLNAPGVAISTVLLENVGLYIENFSAIPYTDEENATLMRFGKVFQQTYTRFLDLQKAEAQVKEARIEAALEKIRSRSLGMHHSGELKDVVAIFFEKLKELDLSFDGGAAIHLFSEGSKNAIIWVASPDLPEPSCVNLPYDEIAFQNNPIITDVWKAKETGQHIYNKLYPFEDKNKYFDYVFKHNDFVAIPRSARNFIRGADSYTASFIAEKNSLLGANSWSGQKFSDNDFDILKRIARVFEQAYVRFLDLQKAEAQSREAQIQLGLERVRARAMAMQNSDELNSLIGTVFVELTKLDLQLTRCVIMITDPQTNASRWWMANSEAPETPMNFLVKYHEHPPFLAYLKAWRERSLKWEYIIEGTIKKDWDDFLFSETELSLLPDFVIAGMRSPERVYLNASFNNFGNLTLATLDPLSNEHAEILLRFAKVFDLTYTRFNDLKQAEAQTREAKIEASLERVRSKAMAMHSSKDLADTIGVFYHELELFSITPRRCGVGLLNKESRLAELSTMNTTEEGKSIEIIGTIKMQGHPVLEAVYDHWLLTKEYHPVLKGNEIKEYYQLLRPQIAFPEYPNDAVQYGYFFFFPEGGVYAWTDKEMGEDELTIYRRFTSVLSLTYKRYKDLQQAEALAVKAAQDLILLKEEKKRTEDALTELQFTQKQLIQSEKMASLGELTAGIAHEIQNPLNFVNNFSEVSNELLDEMMEEVAKGNYDEVKAIADDVRQNLEKISQHGKRADGIVKGMLQHSRASTGQAEPTDINVLAGEYLRLAYHGLRAKDNTFNATLKTDFDETIGKINIIPQDIGRVILNLITNAFYAVAEKKKSSPPPLKGSENYEPIITVSTKAAKAPLGGLGASVFISISDNGNGIPQNIIDKIFQPFFTTKPTGQGTGLGLSLAYDIVKTHGGELKVETKEGEGSEFIIQLPVV